MMVLLNGNIVIEVTICDSQLHNSCLLVVILLNLWFVASPITLFVAVDNFVSSLVTQGKTFCKF